MTTLIGLGHRAQVGKDSIAAYLVENHGYTRLAFADTLKAVAFDANPIIPGYTVLPVGLRDLVTEVGWETAKKFPEVRQFLQNLGVAAREHIDQNVWVRPVLEATAPLEKVVITDVRFPNEYAAIKAVGGLLVRVEREGYGAGDHVSEVALERHHWPVTLENDGTLEDLYDKVDDLLGDVESEQTA